MTSVSYESSNGYGWICFHSPTAASDWPDLAMCSSEGYIVAEKTDVACEYETEYETDIEEDADRRRLERIQPPDGIDANPLDGQQPDGIDADQEILRDFLLTSASTALASSLQVDPETVNLTAVDDTCDGCGKKFRANFLIVSADSEEHTRINDALGDTTFRTLFASNLGSLRGRAFTTVPGNITNALPVGGQIVKNATDSPTAEPTDPPTDEPTGVPTSEPTDPPTDEADDSFAGPASFDQTKWGPISDYVVTIADAGKDSTPHHYVYSNLGESCHHACMRKSPPGDTWYCDDQSLFFVDINADGVTEMNKRSDQIMNDDCLPANSVGVAAGPQDCQGRCTNPTDATVRTISRNKSAWAPFIRADGKCFYAHFKGKHKCYIPRSNNYRLCGCQSYSDAVGEDFAPNMNVVEGDGSTGWHVVTDKNCNNHCESLGLTCNASVLNGFKGAYDMRALENLLTDGALDMCDMWDDRLVKKKNPAYRDVDKRCYVNPVDANGDAACNLMSRSPDTRFCYCGDAMA